MTLIRKTSLIAVGALALMASACGRMADLEAPGAVQNERAPRDRNAKTLPEPATVNRAPSQMPIDSGASDPFGRPPAL